jgi:hypothetical protein
LAVVEDLVTDHLNEVVHELAGRHWLATVPADALACLAARFHLGQDQDLTRMCGWATSTRGYLPPLEWEHQHTAISPLPSTTAA